MPLTKSQLAAIKHAKGNLQLIACAGSGKTEVVARHVTNLFSAKKEGGAGLRPANVVAFTFTEKAAAELKDRIWQRCQEKHPGLTGMAEMYIGTIHGFCLEFLRSEVPQFLKYDVLNEIQQTLLVDRSSVKSGLSQTYTLNGAQLRRYVDTRVYLDTLDILRESGCDPKALKKNTAVQGLQLYEALLHDKGYLDYSAILTEAVRALSTNAQIRKRLAERIKVVITDEYQDVNPPQEALLREFSALGADVRVVGDDDQTIYQWRGSDVTNILTFSERYPKSKTINLEENFRSSEAITDVAELVIRKNANRLAKEMKSAKVQKYEVGDVVARQLGSPADEADYIADMCEALRGVLIKSGDEERAITWSDMAVLIRVTAEADAIRDAFESRGIPFVSVGMNTLFDAPEAEAARQLFYMMVGRASAKDVVAAWKDANLGVAESVLKAAVQEAVKTKAKMEAEDDEVRFSIYNIQRQFMGFLERIGLCEEDVPNGRGELAFYNLAKFSQLISDFESINFHSKPVRKYESFAGFLQYQAENAYGETKGAEEKFVAPDAVQILTIHRSKGLEWPVVFIPQLVKNRFPLTRRGGRTPWHIIPSSCVANQARFLGSDEDERRLFYVAITRSMKFLHMTTAPTPGNQLYQRPSEFWNDVLESKFVKRTIQDYSSRKRGKPTAKPSVSNVNLSFSDMKYFFECPYQFKLRTVYGFNAPLDEALGYGKSLHDALAELHDRAIRGEKIGKDDAEELVDRHLRVPFAYPTLRRTMHDSAVRTVRDYIAARASEFDRIEFSEKPIEISMDDGVSVSGRIDLVRRRDTNEIAIVDLKSTERAQAEDLTEAQLHVYALGYRELTGHDADFVEIYELDTQTRKPRAVDEDLISDVRARVAATAAALRKNSFVTAPEESKCAKCDFKRLCSSCACSLD